MATPDGSAYVNRERKSSWETFTVEDLGGNKVALKSVHGMYLVAEGRYRAYGINANRNIRSSWETFKIQSQQGGRVALKTTHGRYIAAEIDGTLSGFQTIVEDWEQFLPECKN